MWTVVWYYLKILRTFFYFYSVVNFSISSYACIKRVMVYKTSYGVITMIDFHPLKLLATVLIHLLPL